MGVSKCVCCTQKTGGTLLVDRGHMWEVEADGVAAKTLCPIGGVLKR